MQIFPVLRSWPINAYSSPALFAFILIIIETVYMAFSLPETLDYKRQSLEQQTQQQPFQVDASVEDAGSVSGGLRQRKLRQKYNDDTDEKGAVTTSEIKSTTPTKATTNSGATSEMQSSSASIAYLSLLHFLFLFFFSGMEFTLTFLTHDRFAFSHADQGRYLGFLGILSACGMCFFVFCILVSSFLNSYRLELS